MSCSSFFKTTSDDDKSPGSELLSGASTNLRSSAATAGIRSKVLALFSPMMHIVDARQSALIVSKDLYLFLNYVYVIFVDRDLLLDKLD